MSKTNTHTRETTTSFYVSVDALMVYIGAFALALAGKSPTLNAVSLAKEMWDNANEVTGNHARNVKVDDNEKR